MIMHHISAVLATVLLTAASVNALTLIDANKQPLGEFIGPQLDEVQGFIWIARQHGSATYLLLCDRQHCTSNINLEYANPDCTGQHGIRVFDDEHTVFAL